MNVPVSEWTTYEQQLCSVLIYMLDCLFQILSNKDDKVPKGEDCHSGKVHNPPSQAGRGPGRVAQN